MKNKNPIYSRNGEDVWVLSKCQNKENGFFIDIGAAGIDDSNTYLLETLGWNGIAVEPQGIYKLFMEQRRCKKEYMPVYDEKKAIFAFSNIIGWSGIKNHLQSKVYEHITHEVELECITFDELVEKHNVPLHIDYLSLDVEGAELRILQMIDFGKYDITTITVEHNKTPQYTPIKNFILDKGYTLETEFDTGYDFWFYK